MACSFSQLQPRDGLIPRSFFSFVYAAKYPEKFARKYWHECPKSCTRLHEHACPHPNSDLYLDLSSRLFAELNREKSEKSFQQLFRKSFALSFGLLFVQKYQQSWGLSCLVMYRQTLLPRQSLGRPLHGRIVVRNGWTTTYRLSCITIAARPTSVRQRAISYEFVGRVAWARENASSLGTAG